MSTASPDKLWMVHLSDLQLNPNANSQNSIYMSTDDKKFRDDSVTYNRSGQVWPVLFAADAFHHQRQEDTIICSFESCEVCTKNPRAYTGLGYPFVHSQRDHLELPFDPDFNQVGRDLFRPSSFDTGIERTLNDIPLSAVRPMSFRNNVFEYLTTDVMGCDWQNCRVCLGTMYSSPVPAATWFEHLRLAREAPAGAPAVPAIPQPTQQTTISPRRLLAPQPTLPPARQPTLSPDVQPPPPPATQPVPPPPAPNGGALRMCHWIHLEFNTDGTVSWSKQRRNLRCVDTYFVPEELPVYAFGGPIHRVDFPNGDGIRDVMACTKAICKYCNRRPIDLATPSNGMPWAHRSTLTGANPAYHPGAQLNYVTLPDGAQLQANVVEVDGFDDGVRRTTTCWTCVDGTCEECDDDEDVVMEDEGVVVGDGDAHLEMEEDDDALSESGAGGVPLPGFGQAEASVNAFDQTTRKRGTDDDGGEGGRRTRRRL